MEMAARHGDLVIERLAAPITGELTKVRNLVFAGDSSGHTHTLKGAALHRRDGRRTFVRIAKATELVHAKSDGHKTITLKKGDYEVRPLRERGDGADRAVED
jgi:hypothetical protein